MHNRKITRQGLLIILVLSLLFGACRREKGVSSWGMDVLLPIFSANLSINNIIPSNVRSTNTDKSVKLVYNTNLYHLNLSDYVLHIPDTTFSNPFSVGTVGLANKQLHYYYSLGRMATASGNSQLIFITFFNGTNQVIPPVSNINSQPSSVDAGAFFTRAWIKNGIMQINGDNDLPVDLDSVTFQFKNNDQYNNVIGTLTIPHIPAHSHFVDTMPLAGKVVEGKLVAQLLNMKTPGSHGNPVLIDTSKGLQVTMVLYHVTCDSAIAVFPSQSVVDTAQLVTYNYVSGGAKVDFVKIKSGDIRVEVYSSLPDSIHFNYKMPSAKSPFGVPVNMGATAPPAPRGGFSRIARTVDLAGYTIDFTGPNHNMHNTFYDTIRVGIDSTGRRDTLRASDSLYLFYTLENIVPEYATGYLGDTLLNLNFPNISFNTLNKFNAKVFDPEKLALNFQVKNGIGMDAQLKVNQLNASNSSGGSSVNLTAPCIGNWINIPRATDKPLTAGESLTSVNEQNSNVKAILNSKPNQLSFDAQLKINPRGNALHYKDFVYYNSNMDVNLQTEIPLSLIAEDLIIKDTFDFKLNTGGQFSKVKAATFYINIENSFPLQGVLNLNLLDEYGRVIKKLIINETVAASLLNSNCQTQKATIKQLKVSFDANEVELIQNARKAVLEASVSTSSQPTCQGLYLKIYDWYTIKANISARLNYENEL